MEFALPLHELSPEAVSKTLATATTTASSGKHDAAAAVTRLSAGDEDSDNSDSTGAGAEDMATAVHAEACALALSLIQSLIARHGAAAVGAAGAALAAELMDRRSSARVAGAGTMPVCLTETNCVPLSLELRRRLQRSHTTRRLHSHHQQAQATDTPLTSPSVATSPVGSRSTPKSPRSAPPT